MNVRLVLGVLGMNLDKGQKVTSSVQSRFESCRLQFVFGGGIGRRKLPVQMGESKIAQSVVVRLRLHVRCKSLPEYIELVIY